MIRSLLALALLAPAQDPGELIRKLEDDAFDVREQAQAALVKMGEAALPALRKALAESKDQAELRLRVEAAVREIELAAKAREVCPEPRLLTLKTEAPLRDVLEEIARRAGIRIEAAALDLDVPAPLDVRERPLLEVLDLLCRGRADRRWEFVDDERVRLLKEPQPAWPSSYAGAFRVRTTSMKLSRSTDFKGTTASLRVVLEADHERRVKPSKGVEIEITQATDDKGSMLTASDSEEDADGAVIRGGLRINRAWVRMAGGAVPEGGEGETLFLKGLDPAATRVSFQGAATFRFPLDRREIRFAPPTAGDTRDAADLKLRIDSQGAGRWKLTVSKAKPDTPSPSLMEEVQQRIDLESLVGLDDDGGEHKGSFQPGGDTMAARIVVVNGVVRQSVDSVSWLLHIPTLRGKGVKEIRFRFADRVLEKKIPFAFEGLPLP